MREESDRYADFLLAFGRSAGNRDAETREAYRRMLEDGYTPDDLTRAAKAYRVASVGPHGEAKWRFPLGFLGSHEHVDYALGRRRERPEWALETARVVLTPPDAEGYRTPIVLGPMGPINGGVRLPGDVTVEDARRYLLSERAEEITREARHVPGSFDW